jgi:hypothetical protein
LLGDQITQGKPPGAHDLQRNAAGRALIGDPRNDENAIVSQLQGLFLRFHNRAVKEFGDERGLPEIQSFVRHHYQYVVVNDFLPRIVHADVLKALKDRGRFDRAKLKFFTGFETPYMPIEFSAAAYRLGHSMVRPGYRLNDTVLLPIFPLEADRANGNPGFPEGLTGFRKLISDWALDWGRFIDIDERAYGSKADNPDNAARVDNFERLQFAYRIDTALVHALGNLPMPAVVGNNPVSLARRNLERGLEFGLPSGQAVANAMGVVPLKDQDILIGQGVDKPDKPLPDIVTAAGDVFRNNCPLWTYILAEAMKHQTVAPIPVTGGKAISTPQLGPVGGRIVAEVFLGLLFSDPGSYLSANPAWAPHSGPNYGLKDFVRYALGQ